jgi:hypothetical protein
LQSLHKYRPFFVAAALLCLVVSLLYPYLQYYVDPDATAYLTISKRYASGDYATAINGYWSPWSCWLTALFIKIGSSVMSGAIIANTLAGVGLLFVTQLFFLKYDIEQFAQWAMQLALVVFLSYAVYYQNFDDLWECFFLLYALRIIVSHRFTYTPILWVVAGVFGALAYFAKAYSFPYFIISTICIVFYITRAWKKEHFSRWLRICGVAIGIMLLLSSPWIYALHEKYGIWMTSTAGKLNMSWYLVGHPELNNMFKHIVPPVYPNAISYWEDPWFVNGATPHFWDSWELFVRQLMKIAHNGLKFILSSMQISLMFLWVCGYLLMLVFDKNMKRKYRMYYPLLIAFTLFPLPFFLINFEARYIWYMLPLSMLLGVVIIERNQNSPKKWVLIFAISYIVFPVYGINKMWNDGKAAYELSQQLKQKDLNGRIASNVVFGMKEGVEMQRLVYFSGSQYSIMPEPTSTFQELLPELSKWGIEYYYYYPKYNQGWKIVDENDNPFPQVAEFKDVKIYRIYP